MADTHKIDESEVGILRRRLHRIKKEERRLFNRQVWIKAAIGNWRDGRETATKTLDMIERLIAGEGDPAAEVLDEGVRRSEAAISRLRDHIQQTDSAPADGVGGGGAGGGSESEGETT